MPVEERKSNKIQSSTDYGQTVADAIDRGRPITSASSFSLSCVAEINLNFL